MKWITENFYKFVQLAFLFILLIILAWAMFNHDKEIVLQILMVALALFKVDQVVNK